MGKYVYAYKGGGMPESEEEGKRIMEAWTSWFGGLGDSVVDMGIRSARPRRSAVARRRESPATRS